MWVSNKGLCRGDQVVFAELTAPNSLQPGLPLAANPKTFESPNIGHSYQNQPWHLTLIWPLLRLGSLLESTVQPKLTGRPVTQPPNKAWKLRDPKLSVTLKFFSAFWWLPIWRTILHCQDNGIPESEQIQLNWKQRFIVSPKKRLKGYLTGCS